MDTGVFEIFLVFLLFLLCIYLLTITNVIAFTCLMGRKFYISSYNFVDLDLAAG